MNLKTKPVPVESPQSWPCWVACRSRIHPGTARVPDRVWSCERQPSWTTSAACNCPGPGTVGLRNLEQVQAKSSESEEWDWQLLGSHRSRVPSARPFVGQPNLQCWTLSWTWSSCHNRCSPVPSSTLSDIDQQSVENFVFGKEHPYLASVQSFPL